MGEAKKYEPITETERLDIEEIMVTAINTNYEKEEISENYFRYKIKLQDFVFETELSVEDVEEIAKLTVDVMEELKNINNNGMTKEELMKLENEEAEKHDSFGDALQTLFAWKRIVTEQLNSLISELNRVTRVGGAYAMLISNPCYSDAIMKVYEVLVDHFDDEDLYMKGAFLLMRAAMRMHSDDCPEDTGDK